MTILYFDTESTGLIEKNAKWDRDYDSFPRIVSIAWILEDDNEILEDRYHILAVDQQLTEEAIRIHGLTNEMVMSGEAQASILVQFINAALLADKIVGQNIYFDTSIIKASILRLFGPDSNEASEAIAALDKSKRVDLMKAGASYFQGWKKLVDIYEILFKEKFNAHNAQDDMRALRRCYKELIARNVISV